MGIENYGPWYFYVKDNQNKQEEMVKINMFIANFIHNNYSNYKSLTFINYGRYELVYVMELEDGKKYTLLVKQPSVEYGLVRQEYANLGKLANDNKVIKPLKYCTDGEHELYVTQYIEQARCIGVETSSWGVWVPEPNYHFRNFSKEEQIIVTTTMVSMLVKNFDEENNLGISKIRLDGGDFILRKGYEDYIDYKSIAKNIELIAARDMVNMSLDCYVNYLMDELTTNTESTVVVGRKLRKTLNKVDVADGILLGLK